LIKIILFISLISNLLNASINIIISNNSKLINVTKNELINVYLKKTDEIQGQKVVVINNKDNYDEFNKKVLNKTPSQMHAYWMKQVFLGRKIPPKKIINKDIQFEINQNYNSITYTSDEIDAKVIYETN